MALADFLEGGSYSVVDDIFFSKARRMLHFELIVYKDASKEKEISKMHYHVEIDPYYNCVTKSLTTPPTTPDPDINKYYFLNGKGKKTWKGHSLAVCHWSTKEWEIYAATDDIIFVEDEGKYYKVLKDGLEETSDVFGSREFDEAFGIDSLNKSKSNIYKCIYDYLKTRKELSSAKDV